MASIIFAAFAGAKAVYSYILSFVERNVPTESLTPDPAANRDTQIPPPTQLVSNAEQSEKDDMAYIPWPAPASRVRVTPDMLSRDNFVVFHDEILYDVPLTFCHRKLPSPEEVRAASSSLPLRKPHVVPFPALGIVVKFGRGPGDSQTGAASYTSISEAHTLYTIRRFLGNRVPVPEVYAFVHDRDDIFLYMELVQGVTLFECWADLSNEAKMDVCAQLKPKMQALRELEQDPSDPFIGKYLLTYDIKLIEDLAGTIGRQPPQDLIFEDVRIPEPFKSIAAFHDYFCNPKKPSSPHRLRNKLCDNQQICFTHGDINQRNIIVSPPTAGPVRICAIIDWHQSGWYPANWEYCKAKLQTSDSDLRGWQGHLSEFLERWPRGQYKDWAYFTFAFLFG